MTEDENVPATGEDLRRVVVQIDPPQLSWGEPHPPMPWDPHGLGFAWPASEEPLEVIPDRRLDPDGHARAMIAVRRKRHWNGDENWEPPKPDPHKLFGAPLFSSTVEPDPRPYLEPLDPRMGGWRLYDPDRAVAPDRYLLRQGSADEPLSLGVSVYRAPSGIFYRPLSTEILWGNPVGGELRFCVPRSYAAWGDPWQSDNDRIAAEVERRRTCVCGSKKHPDVGIACYCELPGWTYFDEYWTEVTRPVTAPVRPRTLPAQHPAGTWRSRLRDRLWRWTHPILTKEKK